MKCTIPLALMIAFICNGTAATEISEAQHAADVQHTAVKDAQSTVNYAKEALEAAKAALMDIRSQRPVIAGNNEPALESQMETYNLAVQSREEAVRQAENNLKQAQADLQAESVKK